MFAFGWPEFGWKFGGAGDLRPPFIRQPSINPSSGGIGDPFAIDPGDGPVLT